jgi:UDP-glucose 4-epimerase
MSVKVLVTGGCGFVGTNLVAELNRSGGYYVTVFDNEVLGRREFLRDLDCDFVSGDIQDPVAVREALAGVDAVVHLAADTRVIPSIENPRFNMAVNVVGTFTVLDAMREAGVETFVNASTGGAIVGMAAPPVHEEMVPRPLSPYGASKLAVEGYCSAFAASYGIKCLSLRFSNVYGPRSFHKGSVVALFMRQILNGEHLVVYGDGSQTRDYVYVSDLCDGIIAGLANASSGVIQLGSGIPVSLDELIDRVRTVVHPRSFDVSYEPFREGEVRYTYCDISRAATVLGYRPQTPLEEGLSATWEWFQEAYAR